MKTAIVIFSHGSRIPSANDAVRTLAGEVAAEDGYDLYEAAFLDLAAPNLAGAVASLAARGALLIVVIPHFLTLGTHLQRDLPRLVEEVSRAHPEIAIDVTPPLDGHPALRQILVDRAREALAKREVLR